MSFASPADVYYRPGVNCIVTSLKSPKEVNLRFVLGKKQYTVCYIEKKKNFYPRNLSQLLKGSEAVKASIWNVPFGPPGSNKRSWYVTDIWTPHIKEMKKNRIPEPTISIVCRIAYNLGKEFFVCELGKNFPRDVIILPRDLIYSAPAVGKSEAEIGDYLLITAVMVADSQGVEVKLRLTPIWAYWDRNNKSLQSIIHLNIVESGSGKSTLIVQDQIPCMWGVVQAVYKKSMKVYVTALSISISVQYSAVYQYDDTCSIREGDWLQLWLTPKASDQNAVLSEITTWICSNCCIRSKREYDSYLHLRLKSNGLKEDPSDIPVNKKVPEPAAPAKKVQPSDGAGDSQLDVMIGMAKVHELQEKSGTIMINSTKYTFHLGLIAVYGIRMTKIKNVKLKDIVDVGSEIKYKLNPKSNGLKSVWIGPEVVTFKHLNFMPQFTQWIRARNLDTGLVKEMMRELTENYDAVNKNKEKEPPKATKPTKEKKEGKLSSCSSHASQASLVSEGGSSVDSELMNSLKNISLNAENIDFSSFPDEGCSVSSYTKEEVEELEKLWWSDDSDESDDELRPIMKPNAPPSESGDNANGLPEPISNKLSVSVEEEEEKKISPPPAEAEKPEPAKLQPLEDKDQNSSVSVSSDVSSSSAPLGAEGFTKTVEDSRPGKTEMDKTLMQKQDDEDDAKPVTRTKQKDSSGPPSLLIMLELTKFLLEKGKAKSIPEAGELSAEFVGLLEGALSKSTDSDTITCTNVGTQTEITGPIVSVNVKLEDEENLSRFCNPGTISSCLSLVD